MRTGFPHALRARSRAFLLALGAAALGCSAQEPFQLDVSVNSPPSPAELAFVWPTQPGAAAYRISLSLDRGLSAPVGQTGFTRETRLPLSLIAWNEGHPIAGRTYFWVVRAYDRADDFGLLLNRSEAREVRFGALPDRWTPGASRWPATAPSPAPSPADAASAAPSTAP